MPTQTTYRPLLVGEAIAHIHLASNRNPRFALGSLGGRFTLLCVVTRLDEPAAIAAIDALGAALPGFVETRQVAAVLSADPAGASHPALARLPSEALVFTDPTREGLRELRLAEENQGAPKSRWLLLDPTLRLLAQWRIEDSAAALKGLAAAQNPAAHAGVPIHPPALIVPRIFEPAFCRKLIEYYTSVGGQESGVTRAKEDGTTYVSLQDDFKRRTDAQITDATLRQACMQRVFFRLLPEIEKAFMFKVTRMERYIVARYDSAEGGFFKPHRDNTTKGTAHRRFACTINLNAEAYTGGDLRFPEYGNTLYRAPTGGAVVFSCSLLHEATPVTKGERFAFLPFLYDEAAAAIREQNNVFLDESVSAYNAAKPRAN